MASPLALDPRHSVSLQSSAGSGKTWQLVSRVLRLLLEGAEPGGILALTFTRKAAAEMRLRLNDRLRALADASPEAAAEALRRIGLEPAPEVLARARGLYREMLFAPYPPRATTLHAFCQELLSRFALEAGVPPDFDLLENEAELMDRAWRRLQARLVAEPAAPPARALAELVRLGFNEWTLRELVMAFLARRGDWWAYTEDAADPAAHATAALRAQLGACDGDAALGRLESADVAAALAALLRGLEDCGDIGSVKAARIGPALAARGEARLLALEDALLKDGGEPYVFKPAKRITEPQRGALTAAHGAALDALLAARAEWTRAQTFARSAATFTLGTAALEALADELAREHALGFTELEWHACRLLRREGAADWVRCKMDRRVDHLLMDEFQDTSPTQWRMLLPLLEEMAAGDAGRARSLFIVGDAKQSIYGFRRADPRLLSRATDWMRENLRARTEPLHESRRSAPAVIAFVNALYGLGDLGARIGFEPHRTHRTADWGRVEVAPPIEAEAGDDAPAAAAFRDPLTAPRHTREDLRLEREAALVSARIRALVASGIEVAAEHGGTRPIGWGDVLVLARARTHLHHLERQLTADGVPFVGAARGTLLLTSEARDLMALLRLLDAPHRDLELAQVLRSPLFSAGDDALVLLAEQARAGGTPWLAALDALPAPGPALARARALIGRWRGLATRLPAHDLLDRILRDADAAARYERALPPVTAARARANLGAFLQLALEADSGRYPTLSRFLRWLEAQARAARDAPDEAPPAAAGDQVRILTIHGAKGLEAPAVFVVHAGGSQPPRAPRLLVEWPEDAARPTHVAVLGPAGRVDALTRQLADAHKAREAREDLNLLYVAITRARQFLHLSGYSAQRGDASRSWLAHALRAAAALPPAPAIAGTSPGSLAHANGAPGRAAPTPAPVPAAAPDPRLRRPIEVAAAPALAPSARVALDALGADLADAADRGTAVHYLLQRLSEGATDEAALWDGVRARISAEPARRDFERWLADVRALLAQPGLAPFFDRERYRRAWNEVPVTVDGAPAQIDRLVDDGKTLWVLDYKTHARPDATALVARYREQLSAYVAAVRAIWPDRPVRGGLVLTATGAWAPM